MNIFKAAAGAIRKGSDVHLYGPGGARRSSRIQMGRLAGSHIDYVGLAGDLYDNGVVLPGINWKANAVSECELIMEQLDSKDGKWKRATEQGKVAELLAAFRLPNPYYDGMTMWHGVQLSWDCRGNAYLLKRYDNLNRLIGFYWIPHFQMRPLADTDNADGTKLVTRYEYRPLNGDIEYPDPEDVIQIRYGIDPRDPASGLSPLYAELREIAADNEISTWLASMLRNGATPGAILSPKNPTGSPTTAQKEALKDMWQSFVGDKRGEALMAPIPIDVITPTWTPKDMGFDKLREIPTPRIAAALGFDPMVIGLPSSSKTYANYEQAADAAGKMTILPSIRKWAFQCSRQTIEQAGLDPRAYRLNWDISNVSWLQDDTDDRHDRVRKDFDAGLIDRYRAKELIGEEPTDADRDVYATPLGVEQITEGDDDQEEDQGQAPAKKKQTKQFRRMAARSAKRRREFEEAA